MILQLHLSSVFEAIPFHSIFINNVFLVIRSVSIFLRHLVFEDRVYKMCHTIPTHDNPVVRSMGELYQWRAEHRNIFQELCNSEEALIRQIE